MGRAPRAVLFAAAAALSVTPFAGAEPWWREAVFYEVFVRSFADSTRGPRSGDGIGDLAGLIEKLDYLNDGDPESGEDLGVSALWLMPVCESPSYHGYDVTDHYRIEPDYGTRADFERLIEEAHRRGVRVVVDLVLNHTSWRHPWFLEAPRRRSRYHDWYLWSEHRHDYLGPWGQRVWHASPWWQRGWTRFDHLSYYGVFWAGMPDLNHRNPEVRAAMEEITRFWLEEMGVDGFRLDAIRHLIEDGQIQQDTPETHEWLRSFHAFTRRTRPEALLVGEVWADTRTVAGYGDDELDLTFQFDLAREILVAARSGEKEHLAAVLTELTGLYPRGRYATFLSNHDQPRVMTQLGGDEERARLAATLLFTLPGVPFVYYGEEIGLAGGKPDPLIRRPMHWSGDRWAGFSRRRPWQPLQGGHAERNVERQLGNEDSLLAHYRRLIRLRRRHPALATGGLELLDTGSESVLAFARRGGGERIVVLVNLGTEVATGYGLETPAMPGAPRDLLGTAAPRPPDGSPYRPFDRLEPLSVHVLWWPAGGEAP